MKKFVDVKEIKPHDIVQLSPDFWLPVDAPEWAQRSLAQYPYAVMRRAQRIDGLLPLGVRGANRDQRYAILAEESQIIRVIDPMQIAAERRWREMPHIKSEILGLSLDATVDFFRRHALCWGVGGSVGFELVTDCPCTHPDSDLDILVYCQSLPIPAEAQQLCSELGALPVRVDVLLETPHGAVALTEYSANTDTYMLRTLTGPQIEYR